LNAPAIFLTDWALVVIEIIESAHFERTVVRAIPRADATIAPHVQPISLCTVALTGQTVSPGVFAVLTHHRLVCDFRVLGHSPCLD
jgi:hypothetical protein